MGGIVRVFAWGWLLVGLLSLATTYMASRGLFVPIPESLALRMSVPWSFFVHDLRLTGTAATAVTAFGLVINSLIFQVIANILDR